MFPKVQKGQRFQPSASMHNAVVDMLNKTNGMLAGEQKSGNQNMVRISIVNRTGEVLPSGAPVAIDGISGKNMIFSVRKVKKEDVIVAVAQNTLQENAVGSAILCGVCAVSAKGNEEKFVFPRPDSFEWEYRKNGGFPVLCSASDGVLILAGNIMSGTAATADTKNNRPFWVTHNPETGMLDITGGWVIGNGEKLLAKADSLGVQNGYVCVTSELVGINYKEPTFKYGEFAPNCIPIAYVSGAGNNLQIVNFYVSTAVFLETNLHPPCECLGE